VPEKEIPAKSPRLQQTLDALERLAEEIRSTESGVCLGKVTSELGQAAFCFIALLLAVPFFQPISLGPLTMASGGIFMVVGWQMGRGWTFLHLPEKARNWHLRGKGWLRVLEFCRRILVWLSRWTRPRLLSWVDGPAGSRRIGWMIFIGGALLAIPFANMPLNNTFPALMIFFAAVAWLERDGLMVLVSLFWGFVTLLYFAVAGWILFKFGTGLLQWVQGMWSGN
jgi:hypothetical protein